MPEPVKMPPLGTVGRIINPNKGQDWGRDFRVVAYNPTVPPTLVCDSLERLRRWIEPTRENPGGWETDEGKAMVCGHAVPVEWFHPAAPQAPPAKPDPPKTATIAPRPSPPKIDPD